MGSQNCCQFLTERKIRRKMLFAIFVLGGAGFNEKCEHELALQLIAFSPLSERRD